MPRGPYSYGHSTRLHSTNTLEFDERLPLVIDDRPHRGEDQGVPGMLDVMMSGGLGLSPRRSRRPGTPRKDIAIALDPAASSFYADGAYELCQGEGRPETVRRDDPARRPMDRRVPDRVNRGRPRRERLVRFRAPDRRSRRPHPGRRRRHLRQQPRLWARAPRGRARGAAHWIGGAAWLLNANRPASVASDSLPPLAAQRLSLVVLPFSLSGDRAQDYLADALTDTLTTALSRSEGAL